LKKIILASQSPRRRELLNLMGVDFEIQESSWVELDNGNSDYSPEELCCHNALGKARAVCLPPEDDCIIIGCDTIVVLDNVIMGKPGNGEEAVGMLRELSGKIHFVLSGIALIDNRIKKEIVNSVKTEVKFRNLSFNEINNYVKTKEPLDKAGAYGIQGKGALLVEEIKGCYYNVVGLPLTQLYKMLLEIGMDLWDVI